MTKEELLQPRYKVIADYPFNPYNIGDLVEMTATRVKLTVTSEWSDFNNSMVSVENYVPFSRLNEFPALFKKLEWWEDRKVEDMPGYLKRFESYSCTSYGENGEDKEPEIHKVKKHFSMGLTDWRQGHTDFFVSDWHENNYCYSSFEPATEQGYNEYQRHLKQPA
jgi:hypothetical protein